MALTLVDSARHKKDEYTDGVVETFQMECDLSRKLPVVTIGTTEVHTKRTNSIPTVGFRRRGEAFGSVSSGGFDEISDATFPMGATIDIDKTDMLDKAPVLDVMSERTQRAVKGMAWTFNDAAINGDHGTDADSFEGLKVRLATLAASQIVYGVSSAAELEARPGTATTANAQALLNKLDETIYQLDGHKADVCLTYNDGIRAIKSALRLLGINTAQDHTQPYTKGSNSRQSGAQFDQKPVFNYDGVDFFDMGYKTDMATSIVATETVNALACRPFFFVKLGEPYLHAIQQYPMDVGKPYKMPDGVTYRTVIDWPIGLRHVHPKFAAKLAGVRVA